MHLPYLRLVLWVAFTLLSITSWSQELTPLAQLIQQSEQQQNFIRSQITPTPKPASLDFPTDKPAATSEDSGRCFIIHKIILEQSAQSKTLNRYMGSVLAEAGFQHTENGVFMFNGEEAPCLNISRIQTLANQAQNRMIDAGHVTARVLIPEQNLSNQQLKFALVEGKIGKIAYQEGATGSRLGLAAAFPTSSGEALNLRDLEQGLDNMRRLSSSQTQMDILPGEDPQTSDIIVSQNKIKPPYSFSITIDDSGSKNVGRYLGTLGVTWENPLTLNDIFYASYSHTLKPGVELSDRHGKQKSGSHNLSLNYSIPVGYWSFDIDASQYNYDQVVAGQTQNYNYSGDSEQFSFNINRIVFRNQTAKTRLSYGLWYRGAKSYINNTEIDVQRRRMGGWQAHINQQLYLGNNSVNLDLGYKRGTGAFNSMKAPEAYFDEGTERMQIYTADINATLPFNLGAQNFSWQSHFHGQWPKTRLTSLDRLSIGGRNSVRGFDGETTLSAERGWYLRNDLAWHYQPRHQAYLALDTGHVSGPSAKYLIGKSLTGTAIGLKGSLDYHGAWFYDAFAGFPLNHPDKFAADKPTLGFTLSYRWP